MPLLGGDHDKGTGMAQRQIQLESFDLPSFNQKLLSKPHVPNTKIPFALRPSKNDANQSLDVAISTIRIMQRNGNFLTKLLATHGVLLFRGLPIRSADDFSQFTHAFGYPPHETIGIVVERPLLAPNVTPANESLKDVLIYNHNESPQVPHAPGYVFFYCQRAPSDGGETPISSSLELFDRAKDEMPEFVEELAQKGVRSRVTYKSERQHAGGSTLIEAFGKEVLPGDDEVTRRLKIEAQLKRYGRGDHTTWDWQDNGNTLVVTHHLPAIRTQPHTNLPTLFTGLAAYYRNARTNKQGGRSVTQQFFGDGTPIPEEYLKRLAEITDDIRVLHKWQEGDVLVFDNVIAQHGRQPWVGQQEDRIILASLFDGELPGQYEGSTGDWAQVVKASAT